MANKRMFSKKIVESDAFLEMPLSTQCLYFHLGMEADDDGFVGNANRIIRIIGAAADDLKVLIAKKFVLRFDNGVIVIKHWRMNNTIAKTRYCETEYTDEKAKLLLKDNHSYSLTHGTPIDDGKYTKMYDGCLTENIWRTDGEQLENAGIGIGIDIGKGIEEGLGSNAEPPIALPEATEPGPLDSMSETLREAVSDWLEYKKEKRQSYKPTGLKALITEIKNNAAQYGDEAVADVIRVSMSSNYQGIVFDRLKSRRAPAPANRAAQMLDESNEMMRRWAQE